MILGIGIDACDLERIAGVLERRGQRFIERVFTAGERAAAVGRTKPALFYAPRFAAKEACVKALGTGITDRVRWHDIEVSNAPNCRPLLTLSGGALRRLKRLTPAGHEAVLHLSLIDEPPVALAFVVIEANAVGRRSRPSDKRAFRRSAD